MRRFILLFLLAFLFLDTAKADYTLFNPKPDDQLRDLSADRPDLTESPYTVDAGHIQVELDFFTIGNDKQSGIHTETYNIAPFNFKLGLTDSIDIQFLVAPYVNQEIETSRTKERTDGFGDSQVRLKWNLWGNDEGDTALALMPYVNIPTNQRDLGRESVEAGSITTLALDITPRLGLGTQVDIAAIEDSNFDDSYHIEVSNTVVLGYSFTDIIGTYIELVSIASAENNSNWVGLISGGVTALVAKNTQLDSGIVISTNSYGEDYRFFSGLTFRI